MASTDGLVEKAVRRSAEDCPWYLLATIHGVPGVADEELQAKNRRTWNRLMASRLSSDELQIARESGRHAAEDLVPPTPEEMASIEAALTKRGLAALPWSDQRTIDFSNVDFRGQLFANGFLFAMPTDFSGATFSDEVWFTDATFLQPATFRASFGADAWFERATFSSRAWFDDAAFSGRAWFTGTTFSRVAEFRNVMFAGDARLDRAKFTGDGDYARFDSATFCRDARFNRTGFAGRVSFTKTTFCREAQFDRATFCGSTYFQDATFSGHTQFINATMKGQTFFNRATFAVSPARFFGATLHEGTIWRDVVWPPPPRNAEDAGLFVSAYERLKLEMDRLKKHEDELDFFVLEMQSRQVLRGPWKGLPIRLYGWLCDYGRSYARPLCGLLATVALGALPLWPHFGVHGLDKAIGLSLASTFNIFGFRKDFVTPDTIKLLSDLLMEFAALQTVIGAILLFLLGLALRNRFRMR